jgi:hypothetical protein
MNTKKVVLPNLCQFPFADGRSCRMPRSHNHDYLCVFHADRERRLLDQQALDAGDLSDLFGPTGELRTSTEINAYLTRLARHAVVGHISPKILPSLLYAASLLLQTRRSVYNEVCSTGGVGAWIAELRRLYSLRSRPAPPSDPPATQ